MKDQLNNASAQTVDSTPEVDSPEAYRLPPAIYYQVARMQPGDGEALAAVIDQHPELTNQILEAASMHVGARTVRQAIALRHNVYEPNVRVSPELHADAQSIGGDTSYATHEAAPTSAPVEAEPAAAPVQADPAATSKKAEPAWVAHARTYNAANPTLIDEFNNLTGFQCSDGNNEHALNPVDIAIWQRTQGLTPDGKVGPHTIAAARVFRAKADRYTETSPSKDNPRPPV